MNKKEVREKREKMIQHLNNAKNHLYKTTGLALDIGEPHWGETLGIDKEFFEEEREIRESITELQEKIRTDKMKERKIEELVNRIIDAERVMTLEDIEIMINYINKNVANLEEE